MGRLTEIVTLGCAGQRRTLPPEPDVRALSAEIRGAVGHPRHRVVVFDDDPTGVQTVHDIDVLTTCDVGDLAAALNRPEPLFYVLTNSRALTRPDAVALAAQLAERLATAQARAGVTCDVISRSDSTLRGHYPWELDPLAPLCGPTGPHGHLIVPAFPDGGRITVDATHYVAEGDAFIPAAETDFARDPTFGYVHAWLPAWVEEKTLGRWQADEVLHVPLDLLRSGDVERVCALLCTASGNRPIVCDCVTYADLTVLVAALLRASVRGYRFLCRTAASFVKVRAALDDRPLLARADLVPDAANAAGGLVLVGSYVKRTAEQLARALQQPGVVARELSVEALLRGPEAAAHLRDLITWTNGAIASGRTALVYTSRHLVAAHQGYDHVHIAATVSSAVAAIAAGLAQRPAWLIAKGGITSSDVATQGLGVRRARVLGQVATGVPVWRLGPESRFPGLPYIVFPGNVGTAATLAELITMLSGAPGSRRE
jgi:uncharacterized protein YgbK (DUF1537 family)